MWRRKTTWNRWRCAAAMPMQRRHHHWQSLCAARQWQLSRRCNDARDCTFVGMLVVDIACA